MSYTYKTLVRDKLVDNATIKTLFSATLTGSCRVNMENLRVATAYPQVLLGFSAGPTHANLDAETARIFVTVQAKGTGSTHPHKEIGKFRSAILAVLDDTGLDSSTAVAYYFKKFGEVEGYSEEQQIHWLRMGFEAEYKVNTNNP